MWRVVFLTGALAFLAYPAGFALAHEKWFIKNLLFSSKPLLFSEWTSANASLVLLAVFGLLAAVLFHFAIRSKKWTRQIGSSLDAYKAWVPQILRVTTGLLLVTATFSGFLLFPEFSVKGAVAVFAVTRVLLAIQLFTGLGLCLGVFPRFMALMGFTLFLICQIALYPWTAFLPYLFLPGIFVYLFLVGDPALPKVRGGGFFPNFAAVMGVDEAVPYAHVILRILTAVSFIWAGFYYKILEPGYALEFLRMYDINFMPSLGFSSFGNDMFVLSAGLTEVFLGVLILLGILPRLAGAVLMIMFTVTLGMFGIRELLGHLPLYGVAFALLVDGRGRGWKR